MNTIRGTLIVIGTVLGVAILVPLALFVSAAVWEMTMVRSGYDHPFVAMAAISGSTLLIVGIVAFLVFRKARVVAALK